MPGALAPFEVDVRYRFTDCVSENSYADALETLSSDERERAGQFALPRDRMTYVVAHAMLRETLAAYEDVPPRGWSFERNAYDKPVLAGPHRGTNLTFNLAHTRGLVACVVCRAADVGIDVESLPLNAAISSIDLAIRHFSPTEVTSLQACDESDRDTRFIELWTLKEAYLKATGAGLSRPFDTFSFVLDGSSSLRFVPLAHEDASAWQFALFAPSRRHRMAVAIRCTSSKPYRVSVRADNGSPPHPVGLRTSAFGHR